MSPATIAPAIARPASLPRVAAFVLNLANSLPSSRPVSPSLRTIEERDDRGREGRYDVDIVVSHTWQNREAVVRHPGAVPAGVAPAAAEQGEELDGMGRWHPVCVTDYEHDRQWDVPCWWTRSHSVGLLVSILR
jgi:hypothetical protein